MSYNYSQHQDYTAPTVLSQQDASVMAEFFNNPDTSNTDNAYLTYGIDHKSDFSNNNAHMNNHNSLTSDSALTSVPVQPSHANFNAHEMPQTNRMPPNIYDYSASFMQSNHQPSNNHSAGDAVAGASALLGLSTSQEQANLLGANSYMTWPNIVGAHLQAPHNNPTTGMSPVRGPVAKSNSTSQLNTQLQAPPTPATTSWADIQAQEIQQRTRHPSLQLDTTNTHFPSHQQAWQNAPMSAAPHAGRRPPMVKFGSDNHFSVHGFTGPAAPHQEEKQNNLLHLANNSGITGGDDTRAQTQRAVPPLIHRHSISAGMPAAPSTHLSPIMMANASQQLQASFHNGLAAQSAGNGSGRKRDFSQVDGSPVNQSIKDIARQVSGQSEQAHLHRTSSNGHRAGANVAANADSQGTQAMPAESTPAPAARRRAAAREQRAPRQNLTDAQKRQNHIASEQKRRDTMKTNYEILGQRVPAVRDGGAMSRSEILYHLANHMEAVIAGNNVMCRLAGLTLEQLDELPDSDDEQSDDGDD